MSVLSIVVGVICIAACFGLMVWGRNYLGENAARRPNKAPEGVPHEIIDHPCRNCGSCFNKKNEETTGNK
ncbi:MAG: hypothetical protein JW768_00980 [Chitinispirillaceae bacterium]|nr:hypothetical protein [Chitinispirillaceae bacterium]